MPVYVYVWLGVCVLGMQHRKHAMSAQQWVIKKVTVWLKQEELEEGAINGFYLLECISLLLFLAVSVVASFFWFMPFVAFTSNGNFAHSALLDVNMGSRSLFHFLILR